MVTRSMKLTRKAWCIFSRCDFHHGVKRHEQGHLFIRIPFFLIDHQWGCTSSSVTIHALGSVLPEALCFARCAIRCDSRMQSFPFHSPTPPCPSGYRHIATSTSIRLLRPPHGGWLPTYSSSAQLVAHIFKRRWCWRWSSRTSRWVGGHRRSCSIC